MTSRAGPLYRKVNRRTHSVQHGGGEARWGRHAKGAVSDDRPHGSMHAGQRHGLDYTPLFRFLLSRVGQDWDAVFSQAVARLDRPEPIWWIVARHVTDERAFVRLGEHSYWSGLKSDDQNRLVRVAPDLTVDDMLPTCACCTHTLNGQRFTRPFQAG